jgi:hypothetical protein
LIKTFLAHLISIEQVGLSRASVAYPPKSELLDYSTGAFSLKVKIGKYKVYLGPFLPFSPVGVYTYICD